MSTAAVTAPRRAHRTLWQFLDDLMNPIVVKELRQAVSSKFVVAILIILLLMQLLVIGIYMLTTGMQGRFDAIDAREGRMIFAWLQGLLLGVSMLFLPLYTGIRLAAERSGANTDLLFVTTISPLSIIVGKLVSAFVLATLIFSACFPFMALTYYLRGIDWLSILYVLAIDFLVIMLGVQIMIFLAVIPCNMIFKVFLGLGGLIVLFMMTQGCSLFTWALLFERQMMLMSFDFWLGTSAFVLCVVGVGGLLFTWSIALLSPPSSNRALPVRLYLLGLWIVTLAAAYGFTYGVRDFIPMIFWYCTMIGLACLSLFVAINERPNSSPRVARTIPKNILLRIPAFFFFDGSAGGVLFSLFMALATAGALVASTFLLDSSMLRFIGVVGTVMDPAAQNAAIGVFLLFIYAYAYALTAVIVQHLFRGSIPHGFTWIVLLFILAIGCTIPLVITLLLYLNDYRYEQHYQLLGTIPFTGAAAFFDWTARVHDREAQRIFYLTFATAWALIGSAICVRYFVGQASKFHPPAPVLDAIVIESLPETAEPVFDAVVIETPAVPDANSDGKATP